MAKTVEDVCVYLEERENKFFLSSNMLELTVPGVLTVDVKEVNELMERAKWCREWKMMKLKQKDEKGEVRKCERKGRTI